MFQDASVPVISPIKCSIKRDYKCHIHDSSENDAVPHLPEGSVMKDQKRTLEIQMNVKSERLNLTLIEEGKVNMNIAC